MTEEHMHLPKRSPSFPEWNFNTLVQIIGLLLIFASGVGLYYSLKADVDKGAVWRVNHEVEVKDIRSSFDARIDRLSSQNDMLDDRLDKQEAMTVRLADRLATAEPILHDLQKSMSAQSADIKVILAYIEEQRRQQERGRQ